jgi:alanine dehydrogenase
MNAIGIRHEDKSTWERRVPLVPEDVRQLATNAGLVFRVQESAQRAFPAEQYRAAGATIVNDLDDCPIIMGVKEIPVDMLRSGKTYIYFSHTHKGQPDNMPALRRLLELGCTLIDYEHIVDDENRRLAAFGRFAGLAGMIDSLWALGKRLTWEGIASPFAAIQPAHAYDDLEHVQWAFAEVAAEIRTNGLPPALQPFVCGFAGYGQVSLGAQWVYDLLPVQEITPEEVLTQATAPDRCYKVVYREQHLVKPATAGATFDLQEYYEHPDRYEADFFPRVAPLTLLINCIYWEPRYPRLLDRTQLADLYGTATPPHLRVIGDITCDIDGSVACTTRATTPEAPIYVYDPQTGETHDGVEGRGPVVLAVDFLPCELPVDASRHFSGALRPFIADLARADLSQPLVQSGLPPELLRATVVYQGELTESYSYLREHVEA